MLYHKDLFVGMATYFVSNSFYLKPNNISIVVAEFILSLPNNIKLLPVNLTLICAILGILLYHVNKEFIITDPIYNSLIDKDNKLSL